MAIPSPITSAPSAETPRGPSVSERGVFRHDSLRVERWSVQGNAKVLRDVDARDAELRGTVSVGGTLRADRLDSGGRLEVAGAVEVTGSLTGRGELGGGATIRAGELRFRGRLRSTGPIVAERTVDVTGWMHCAAVTASQFRAHGVLEIAGPVRAEEVELRLRPGSQIGPVHGGSVRIAAVGPGLLEKLMGPGSRIVVDRVEARRAEISGVEVGFVRAPEIVLGPLSRVTAVEGTVVRRHPTSRLGPESRSLPPYGLTR